MINEEVTKNHTPEMIVTNDKDKDANLQQNSLNEKKEDTNLEEEILSYVARSKATFKSQQKDDPDLTFEQKLAIACDVFKKSKCLFLSKFGHYIKEEHLKYFEKDKDEDYEIAYHINRLQRYFNNSTRRRDIRNRRYQALKTLISEGEYFSETEMMKRNPLLYEQLIGQYMTEKQKQIRDNIDTENITFVNLLMESIDRDSISKKQKLQEEEEQNVLEETESDDEGEDSCILKQNEEETFQWGRMEKSDSVQPQNRLKETNERPHSISKKERQMLKQEFVSNMYENFLDGKDTDFDYSTVDNNEAYDNIDLRTQDEEEKYFDSEPPEVIGPNKDTNEIEAEDELDIYMKSLKEQVATSTDSSDNLVCDN